MEGVPVRLSAFGSPLIAALVIASPATAAEPRNGPTLRPVTENARLLLEDTLARSRTARAIAEQLDATDLIVHVAFTSLPNVKGGVTMLVATAGPSRYVRILINQWLPRWECGPILAHELWHTLEIAKSPITRDTAGMRELYRNARSEATGHDRFDTEEARSVQRLVDAELRRRDGES
jgi:hypothetical protein